MNPAGNHSGNIRILVADDHALFRSGLKALFASVDGAEVVGEAATKYMFLRDNYLV